MKSTSPIAALFGRSPFTPMQEHMHQVQTCVSLIPTALAALIENDAPEAQRIQTEFLTHKEGADALKREIRRHLPRGLFMPVDRRDLLVLLDRQDHILSTTRSISTLLTQRPLGIPTTLGSELVALSQEATGTCRQAMTIVDELDELIETGFRGPEAERVERLVAELDRLGRATDDREMVLTRHLFDLETNLDPVTLLLLHQLIQWIGVLADGAEQVGDHLLLLIAR